MKILIITLAVFFISFASFGCTDFSGKYYDGDGSDESNTFKIFQTGCEFIEYDGLEMKFLFDGKDYLFLEWGTTKVYINNRLEADKWIQQTKTITPLEDGSLSYESILAEKFLDSDSNIKNILHYDNGIARTSITKRVEDSL